VVRILLDDRLQAVRRQQFVLIRAQMQRDGRAALRTFDRLDVEIALAGASTPAPAGLPVVASDRTRIQPNDR